MAEALIAVDDPAATLVALEPAPCTRVRAAMLHGLAPPEAEVPPPPWLRPEQGAPFRRAVAALERHGAALLADPVGSGKTWIALAAAERWRAGPVVALVPAILRPQWARAAREAGVAVTLASHEAASRGRLPALRPGLVIVDESHRFRNPATRRYAAVLRWLRGAAVLCLSATPAVNRLEDLAHQLLLGLRDDTLAARGLPSVLGTLRAGSAHPALGDVVLARARPAALPGRRARLLPVRWEAPDQALLAAIERLGLSRQPAVRTLLRGLLVRALASSPAALAASLARYRALLTQAGEARRAGRRVSRAELRRLLARDADQLLLWELLPDGAAATDLRLSDRAPLAALEARCRARVAQDDHRSAALRGLIGEGGVTLVFTVSRDTLHWLRGRLADLRPAWLTGSEAGLGHGRLEREAVLRWFGPDPAAAPATPSARPTVLLATDVAAEGLNLQRARRVVHYDLPWTGVRLEQREGRARRLGGEEPVIEVVGFAVPPEIEARLRQLAILERKRTLPAAAGLGDRGRGLFRWRAELAASVAGPGSPGIAIAAGPSAGWLVGLALDELDPAGHRIPAPASAAWLDEHASEWREADEALLTAIAPVPGSPDSAIVREARTIAGGLIRQRLALAEAARYAVAPWPGPDRLGRRLRRLGVECARARDRAALALVERGLAWLAGGVTAAEAALAAELAPLPTAALLRRLDELLARPRATPLLLPRLTGIVRVTSFLACQTSAPCCSTSTAP